MTALLSVHSALTTVALPHLAIPNGPSQAPPGVGGKVGALVGYVKFGVEAAIFIGFLVGVGLFAAGKIFHHSPSATQGPKVILSSLGAAVLFAVGYNLLVGLSS